MNNIDMLKNVKAREKRKRERKRKRKRNKFNNLGVFCQLYIKKIV